MAMQYPATYLVDDLPVVPVPLLRHLVETYASETNKTASVWTELRDDQLDFAPHRRSSTIRQILTHQILSERRFFAEFIGLAEPPVESLLPPGEAPGVAAYIERLVALARARLPALAAGDESYWLAEVPFFDVRRERIWVFWRRVLHTCHHRTQVQAWLRLAGCHVPAIYGPSGDVTWSEADPTYSLDAAKRGG